MPIERSDENSRQLFFGTTASSETYYFPVRMRAILCSDAGLVLGDVERSTVLYPGQVFIKIFAVSLTPFDVGLVYSDIRRYFDRRKLRSVSCSCFSGIVVSVGDGVSGVTMGDEVIGLVGNPVLQGCGEEYIAIESKYCTRKPGSISHSEAVSLVWDCMCAERLLRTVGTKDTDSILVSGGSTNFSRVLIQMAKSSMFGVEWIASTVNRVPEKEYVESLGADETFDVTCNGGEWSAPFSSGSNMKSYEVVIDVVGDSKGVKKLVAENGGRFISLFDKISVQELLSLGQRNLSSRYKILFSNSTFGSVSTGSLGRKKNFNYYSIVPTGDGEILERICVLIETGAITPLVEKEFTMDEIGEAVEFLKLGWPNKIRGCIVIKVVV